MIPRLYIRIVVAYLSMDILRVLHVCASGTQSGLGVSKYSRLIILGKPLARVQFNKL
jgi:hypothetical protein